MRCDAMRWEDVMCGLWDSANCWANAKLSSSLCPRLSLGGGHFFALAMGRARSLFPRPTSFTWLAGYTYTQGGYTRHSRNPQPA